MRFVEMKEIFFRDIPPNKIVYTKNDGCDSFSLDVYLTVYDDENGVDKNVRLHSDKVRFVTDSEIAFDDYNDIKIIAED